MAARHCSPQLTAAFFLGQKLCRRGFELRRGFLWAQGWLLHAEFVLEMEEG